MLRTSHLITLATFAVAAYAPTALGKTPDGKPLIVFIAGKQSHGAGEHEHNAGVQLLAKCLAQGAPNVATKVHLSAEWPSAEEMAQADTIVIYSDGGGGHPALKNLPQLGEQMKRGCGFVCLHYAVEVPKSPGGPEFRDWLGGYFEPNWSVNPHWTANFTELPKHPISNGVKPFSTNDEWYYHMRFREAMKGVTPILTDLPPEATLKRGDGPHSGNPDVRKAVLERKEKQHTAWAVEREDGGRGFGFTGGHFHKGWANEEQRKLVLNGIIWSAKVAVPADGVKSAVTDADMAANLDPKGQPKPKTSSAPAFGEAKPIAQSKIMRKADGATAIKADLKGAKELHLVVTDGGDGYSCDWADWVEPVLIKADGSKINLTSLKWKYVASDHGEVRIGKNSGGGDLRIKGDPFKDGIGTHAVSLVSYDLPPDIASFEAKVGLDNGGSDQEGCGSAASVQFLVFTASPSKQTLTAANAPKGGGSGAERYGLEKAKANMATFTAAEGLKASLFAAEPMVQNPTNIDIDPRGRVWATECLNYRKYMETRPEGDRVVILEDTNGDGEADSAKTFFQSKEMTNPLGICVLPQPKGTKVLVSAAPWVWLLTDKDGDDVAEDAVKVFNIGGVWNYDHQVHSFVFGPEGKFYFNAGNSITELNYPDGTRVKDMAGFEVTNKGKPYRQGMVYRCDIDLATGKATNIETLGHNFRNNYETAIDSFGAMWQSDNDDDGNKGVRINYVMEFGNYGFGDEITGAAWQAPRVNIEKEIPLRHWHLNDPGVVPNLLQTGAGSPTGITINEGAGIGKAFENQIIHCDAGPRTTRAYPVEKDGAGYKATMLDLLTSTDSWYRVSDLAVAPDGSMYISDWYDPGVGGHAMGDNQPGKIMGRVYRVALPNLAKASAPDFSTVEGAAKALRSPNRATQYAAYTALNAAGAKAVPALEEMAKDQNPRMRARAMGFLARTKGSEIKALRAGLADPDENVRMAAIRFATTLDRSKVIDIKPLEDDSELLGKLLRDTPGVRRQLALSLYRSNKGIEKVWADLAVQHDGKDRWNLEALGIGATGNEDLCFETWLSKVGEKWNTPAGRDIVWRMRSAKAAGYLAKILEDKSIADSDKPRYIRAFDFLPASEAKSAALVELATTGKVAEDLAREALIRLKGSKEPSVAEALNRTLDKAKGTAQFVELVRDFGASGRGAALLDTAIQLGNNPAANDAIKLVMTDADAAKIVSGALAGDKAPAVVNLLATSGNKRALELVTALVSDANASLETRRAAVAALGRTQQGAQALISLAKNAKLDDALKPSAGTALRAVQYASLKSDIDQLFPAPAALGGKPLPAIAELVKMKGDIAKGKAVAERAESSCVICHRFGNSGVDFGPALTEIGGKLPKEALYDSIINPNAGVSMGFETVQLSLKDGGAGMGILRSETGDEVVLVLPGGATQKFARNAIAKREKLTTSLMPSGLNQALTQEDLVNLVEYLASLKKP
jgi:putative membrane-bound dehydrogenase-like protein